MRYSVPATVGIAGGGSSPPSSLRFNYDKSQTLWRRLNKLSSKIPDWSTARAALSTARASQRLGLDVKGVSSTRDWTPMDVLDVLNVEEDYTGNQLAFHMTADHGYKTSHLPSLDGSSSSRATSKSNSEARPHSETLVANLPNMSIRRSLQQRGHAGLQQPARIRQALTPISRVDERKQGRLNPTLSCPRRSKQHHT